MSSIEDLMKQLAAPFSYNDIEWRIQQTNDEGTRGRAVPYLRFQAVVSRLDDVVGPVNWKNEYLPGPAGGVVCRLLVRVGEEWLAKENGAENTSYEPVKGGLTDALKRAGVMWGIGRYLYNFSGCHVDIDSGNGRMLSMPRLPRDMLPEAERDLYSLESALPKMEEGSPQAEDAVRAGEPNGSGVEDKSVDQAAKQADTAVSVGGAAPASSDGGSGAAGAEPAVGNASESPTDTEGAASTSNSSVPSEKSGFTLEDALESAPEGLEDAHVQRIKTILTRSWDNPELRPSMRNYVNDRSKAKMPEQAIFYVLEILTRLDELDGISAAA